MKAAAKKKAGKTSIAFTDATMPERVRLALPIARRIVTDGLSNLNNRTSDEDVSAYVAQLIADRDQRFLPNDDPALSHAVQGLDAAFCLGAACGLLMRLEAFERGLR